MSFKILHLSNVLGERKGGGIHEVVSNYYIQQKNLSHQPHIWHPGEEEDADTFRLDKNIFTLPGKRGLGSLKSLWSSLPGKVKEFDILHQHGIWTPMSLLSLKIKKKYDIKSVIQPHGFLEPLRLEMSKYKKKAALKLFEDYNLRNCSALIACSENEAEKLKSLYPKNDIAIIHNGISKNFIDKKLVNLKSGKQKKQMLFLSQIIPVKGLERFIRVIAHLGKDKFKDWEILIAGYGNEDYIHSLQQLAIDYAIDELISFVGTKFGDAKFKIIDESTVFVLPTLNENFGIVVIEALARGVPVLTTKGTPWEELKIHDCGFWVENSEQGLREGLLKIISLPEEALKAMGENGKLLVKDKYMWEKTTARTIELYQWVLGMSDRPDFII